MHPIVHHTGNATSGDMVPNGEGGPAKLREHPKCRTLADCVVLECIAILRAATCTQAVVKIPCKGKAATPKARGKLQVGITGIDYDAYMQRSDVRCGDNLAGSPVSAIDWPTSGQSSVRGISQRAIRLNVRSWGALQ